MAGGMKIGITTLENCLAAYTKAKPMCNFCMM